MTQASKERKRRPMRTTTVAEGDSGARMRILDVLAKMGAQGGMVMVLPSGATMTYLHPRLTMTTAGISVRAGVGGRRGRRRRAARERRRAKWLCHKVAAWTGVGDLILRVESPGGPLDGLCREVTAKMREIGEAGAKAAAAMHRHLDARADEVAAR